MVIVVLLSVSGFVTERTSVRSPYADAASRASH
jgi:hypothetical protein